MVVKDLWVDKGLSIVTVLKVDVGLVNASHVPMQGSI
jgi:hypothetical protein